jgi:hypothetical protein
MRVRDWRVLWRRGSRAPLRGRISSHDAAGSASPQRRDRVGDDRLAEGDPVVAGRDVGVEVDVEVGQGGNEARDRRGF